MKHQPPKLPLRLFRFFCCEERLEELEGDLFEVYHEYIREKGRRFSGLFYWWLVMRSFRRYALKRSKMKNTGFMASLLMFTRHNLKVAGRNLLKHKATSAINIIGLAIGISGFLAIYSVINYELSFDKNLPDRDRIYRVYTQFTGVWKGTNRGGATAIPGYLRENAPIVEQLTSFFGWQTNVKVPNDEGIVNDLGIQRKIILADSSYFNMIDQYQWLVGSAQSLAEPNKLVLARAQAERYFPGLSLNEMINKRVYYEDSLEVYVSGIVEIGASNTDFDFTDFISYSTSENTWVKARFPKANDWISVNSGTQVFIKFSKNAMEEDRNTLLADLNREVAGQEQNPNWTKENRLEPLSNLHFSTLGIFDHSRSSVNLKTLYLMLGVAIALLIIAIFNFINLATAQATNNAKEVGLRKVMGSSRSLLVGRFLTESALVVFLAMIISVPCTYIGLDTFEEFIPLGMSLKVLSPSFLLLFCILFLGVTWLAGTYPAWIISSFLPVESLKVKIQASKHTLGGWVRKLLISFQFVVSQVLIVGTMALSLQLSYMLNKDLGFRDEGVVYIRTPALLGGDKQQVFYNELKTIPAISHISHQGNPPSSPGYYTSTMTLKKDSVEVTSSVNRKSGDENYIRLYDIELLAGGNMRKNETYVESIINEAYAHELGYLNPEDAVGLVLESGEQYKVVGVCRDFHISALRHEIEPTMITYRGEWDGNGMIGMKIQTGNISDAVLDISEVWESVYPGTNLEIQFLDEVIERFYEEEKRASKLASLATVVAISISCLGLFGLISFIVSRRSKEVGIRKVLGASSTQISTIISKEFILLVAISFIVATPISYFMLEQIMENYAYRVAISLWLYILGGSISFVVSMITVGTKVWKVALSNPVDSLRYE